MELEGSVLLLLLAGVWWVERLRVERLRVEAQ